VIEIIVVVFVHEREMKLKKFWKIRCCCSSKNFFEPTFQEKVIEEGDDNPAFENQNTKTATISSPTKYRSSVFIDSLDKTSLQSRNTLPPENAKKVEFSRETSHVSENISSSVMLRDEFSDM